MFEYDLRRPKWIQIVEEIQRRIESGEYGPETKLAEPVLEEEFGVSRPTVRKALEALRDRGWIITTPGVGSFPTTQAERQA